MGLTDDPAFAATTFVVIDFESTTPTGHPAQPIEVAALAVRHQPGGWSTGGKYESLIRPPEFAPVTPDVTAQTGLTVDQVAQAPSPADALGALDRRFSADTPYLLVSHHAPTEANLIHNQRQHCPTLARVDLLDTIPFAKAIVPGLPNYKLDTLLLHFSIPMPVDRHRAGADVAVTVQVFFALVRAAAESSRIRDLADLVKVAGRTAKANIPVQTGLFDLDQPTPPSLAERVEMERH